jgi:hypothetical protein
MRGKVTGANQILRICQSQRDCVPQHVRVARNEPCVRGAQNNNPKGDAQCCASVAGRDVVPNVPDHFGGPAFERLGRTRREGREGKPDHSSFARREEEKWDAEDSVPPSPNAVATRGTRLPQSKPRWGFVFLIRCPRVAWVARSSLKPQDCPCALARAEVRPITNNFGMRGDVRDARRCDRCDSNSTTLGKDRLSARTSGRSLFVRINPTPKAGSNSPSLPARNERGEDRGEGKPTRTRLLSPPLSSI